ncbi:MAG: hypothetical protein AB7K71_23770 [Polyangiaceae bacterium]
MSLVRGSLLASALFVIAAFSPSLASAQECVPACRSGYVCVDAQCVSACNPPCGNGESCVGGECVVPSPPPQQAAPPAGYAPSQGYPQQPAPASQPEPQYVPPAPPPAPADPMKGKRPYLHDGFYMQFALGVGYLTGTADNSSIDVEASGVAQLGQLALGGTLGPNFVLGGGAFGVNVFTTKYAVGPANQANFNKIEGDGELSSASVIGPFAAYYFDPTQGVYAMGALGINVMSTGEAKEEVTLPETSGTGVGVVLGVGYEGFVSEQWSVGGLARVMYLSAELDPEGGGSSVDFTGWVPGLLLTVTLH